MPTRVLASDLVPLLVAAAVSLAWGAIVAL